MQIHDFLDEHKINQKDIIYTDCGNGLFDYLMHVNEYTKISSTLSPSEYIKEIKKHSFATANKQGCITSDKLTKKETIDTFLNKFKISRLNVTSAWDIDINDRYMIMITDYKTHVEPFAFGTDYINKLREWSLAKIDYNGDYILEDLTAKVHTVSHKWSSTESNVQSLPRPQDGESADKHEDHEVVASVANGKDFLYCRNCKVEVNKGRTVYADKGTLYIGDEEIGVFDSARMIISEEFEPLDDCDDDMDDPGWYK